MISNNINNKFLDSLLRNFISGKKESSINELKKFVQNNKNNILALYNLGVMYQETGQSKKAINIFLQVIKRDKNNWKALTNLGLLHFAKKEYKESNKYHYATLKIKNNYQPALRDIGTNNLMLHNYEIAENFLLKSLTINPVDYICLNSLGVVKMRLDKHEEAKQLYEKAININKEYYTSYNNLGLYFDRIGNKEEALKQFKKCLDINPNYPNALNNLGLIYFFYEKNQKAFECFNKALKIDPKMIDLYFNIADTYFKLRKFNKSETWYKKGFTLDPKNINGHYNYSFFLLALQKYKKAWEEYEYRLKKPAKINEISLYSEIEKKIWKNQKIVDQKILVIREQGAGDEILYSSMYKELSDLNNNVIFESDSRLISLFNRSFRLKLIPSLKVSNNKKALKNIDLVISAGSLGRIFRQKKQDFPKVKKYLIPNQSIAKKIKSRLDKIDNKPKIGISWFSKNKRIGGGKSISLEELFPLLRLKEVSYINMQYGDHKEEIKKFKNKRGIDIIDLEDIDKFNDFESLAALIDSLDLFITVSNTTAHLSGAIGKETWVMAPKNDSLLFYWNTGQKKTPWYSKIKIYPKINSWNTIINDIKLDLKKWLKKH